MTKSDLSLPVARLWSIALALVLVVGGASVGRAQDAKIGYVNSERLFAEYEGFIQAKQAYQRELDVWLRDIQTREQELVDLEAQYRAQQPMLSDDRRLERESELQRKAREYEQFKDSIFGQGGKAEKRNQELLEPVLATVQNAIDEIAQEQAFDLVFDAVDGNIVFSSNRLDLTETVLDQLRGQTIDPDLPGEPADTGEDTESDD